MFSQGEHLLLTRRPKLVATFVCWIGLSCWLSLPAAPAQDAAGFFTNLASCLMKADLNLEISAIQVYPTNHYSPAVHRLLQVTANLYDATTNRTEAGYPYPPTVIRPLFRRDNQGHILIAGYREVTDAGMADPASAPAMLDLLQGADRLLVPPTGTPFDLLNQNEPMVMGIPLVIGVKQGFPGFSQFALQNAITATRTLRFRRPLATGPVVMTNQAYALSVSNSLGVQFWNSWTNTYPRPLQLSVAAEVTLLLTNESGPILGPDGSILSNRFTVVSSTNISANTWTGFVGLPTAAFRVPLLTNITFLPSSVFLYQQNRFVNAPTNDGPNIYPVPRWWVDTRVQLRVALVDTAAGRIVDYVSLSSAEPPVNVMELMRANAPCGGIIPGAGWPDIGSLWCTNRLGYPNLGNQPPFDNASVPTYGVMNQVWISFGQRFGGVDVSDEFWRAYNSEPTDREAATAAFFWRLFNPQPGDPTNLDFATPFNPRRTIYQHVSWQVNDPLVHYTVPDLIDLFEDTNMIHYIDHDNPVARLTSLNPLPRHFRPWGIETFRGTRFLVSLRDPWVRGANDWNFPAGEPLNLTNLGRVHRGTPWQSIYLKGADVNLSTWALWTGNRDSADAVKSRPVKDRRLVSLLGRMLTTTHPGQLLSANDPDTNAWLAALDGLAVWTNSSPPQVLVISSNSAQAAAVVAAIQQLRSTRPGQAFRNLGDLLEAAPLTDASPFLNFNNLNTYNAGGITDEAYEALPSCLLPLLMEDSVGSIARTESHFTLQFSGYDRFPYAFHASTNLVCWTAVATNRPANGILTFPAPVPAGGRARFYRSRLLP